MDLQGGVEGGFVIVDPGDGKGVVRPVGDVCGAGDVVAVSLSALLRPALSPVGHQVDVGPGLMGEVHQTPDKGGLGAVLVLSGQGHGHQVIQDEAAAPEAPLGIPHQSQQGIRIVGPLGGVVHQEQSVLPPEVDLPGDLRPHVPHSLSRVRHTLFQGVRPCGHGEEPLLISPGRQLAGVDEGPAALPDGRQDGKAHHGGLALLALASPNGYFPVIEPADQLIQGGDTGSCVGDGLGVHLLHAGDLQKPVGRQLVGVPPELVQGLHAVLVPELCQGGASPVDALCCNADLHRGDLPPQHLRQGRPPGAVRPHHQDEGEGLQERPGPSQGPRAEPQGQGCGVDPHHRGVLQVRAEPQAVRRGWVHEPGLIDQIGGRVRERRLHQYHPSLRTAAHRPPRRSGQSRTAPCGSPGLPGWRPGRRGRGPRRR